MNKKLMNLELFAICLFSIFISLMSYPVNTNAEQGESVIEYDLSNIDANDSGLNESSIEDPFEGLNRLILGLNQLIYKIVDLIVVPYDEVTPAPVKESVSNFFSNLSEPVRAANFVFQGDPDGFGDSAGRFITNSTFGVGGLFDVAAEAGIKTKKTDFGLTLRKQGLDTGPYIMLPVIGPSSARDTVGKVADAFLDPFNYSWLDKGVRATRTVVDAFDTRYRTKKSWDNLESTSLDFYTALRSVYYQNRKLNDEK